jgi:hypothetical protein
MNSVAAVNVILVQKIRCFVAMKQLELAQKANLVRFGVAKETLKS